MVTRRPHRFAVAVKTGVGTSPSSSGLQLQSYRSRVLYE